VLGVWLLLGRIGGPWWSAINRVMGWLAAIAWPLVLIAVGVLLLVAGRKGGLGKASTDGRRLYRSRTERMVGGVLGGVAQYFGADPRWVRVAFVVLAVLTRGVPAIVAYIIAMIVVPEEPRGAGVEAPVWPQAQPPGTETVQTPPPPPPVPPVSAQPPQSEPPAPPSPPQA